MESKFTGLTDAEPRSTHLEDLVDHLHPPFEGPVLRTPTSGITYNTKIKKNSSLSLYARTKHQVWSKTFLGHRTWFPSSIVATPLYLKRKSEIAWKRKCGGEGVERGDSFFLEPLLMRPGGGLGGRARKPTLPLVVLGSCLHL